MRRPAFAAEYGEVPNPITGSKPEAEAAETENTLNEMEIEIDLGDRRSHLCAFDRAAGWLEETRSETTAEALTQRLGR